MGVGGVRNLGWETPHGRNPWHGMAMMHGMGAWVRGSGFLAPCRGGRHSDSFRLSFFFTSDEAERRAPSSFRWGG